LTINPGSPGALEVQLKPGINLIGRGFANDFKIENPSVSSSHSQIIVEQGKTVLRDLGSTNGTFVNRTPVKETVLLPGQTIHLGGVEIIFQDGPSAAADIGNTEVLRAVPAIPRAVPVIPAIPAIPVQPKPAVATPAVASAPQPIPAIQVTPRVAQPVGGTPVVATPLTPPGAPPPIKPFPLPGSPASSIPAVPQAPVPIVAKPVIPAAARPVTAAASPAPVAIPAARPVATTAPSPRVPTAAPVIPIEIPAKPVASISSSLRISGSSHTVIVEAPAPIPEPAMAPEALVPVTGSGNCKHHPKTLGRYFCNSCHQFYCELCVGSRNADGVRHKTCRHCGTDVAPVQVKLQRPVQIGFFKRIPGSLAYPLRGAGVIIMLVGIVLMMILRFGQWMIATRSPRPVIFGLMLQVFAGGYLFTYLQSIIFSTVAEDREMPDLPGISSFVEDVVFPFLRLLGLVACCFGPAIALEIVAVINGEVPPALLIAIVSTAILGELYFPMAFLAVATLDSLAAANPLVILPSILKVPIEYLVTVVLLGGVIAFRRLGDFLLKAVFPQSFETKSMGELFAMIGAMAFWGFLGFYLLIVTVHILGLLYVSKKDKLGWLDR
jgi:hypothetical protein